MLINYYNDNLLLLHKETAAYGKSSVYPYKPTVSALTYHNRYDLMLVTKVLQNCYIGE